MAYASNTAKVESTDSLTTDFRKAVTAKLQEWVEAFPEPDAPMIGIAGGPGGETKTLSARQILREVQNGTTIGDALMKNWMELVIKTVNVSSVL
jgi:hypothetical protein